MSSSTSTRRLVIVSNRLPITVRLENGTIAYGESAGGLATGLSSFLDSYRSHFPDREGYVWVGWPGSTIPPDHQEDVRQTLAKQHRALPVFLSGEEMDEFYLGFCNKTLWPLFHYFPSYTTYREDYWARYVAVNERFAEALKPLLLPDDVVWIQDYHLMLLPQMLRAHVPQSLIGFFLHIPFPSFELFRLLPPRWREAILEGVLGSDLVGFHTYEYTRHFLQSVLRILGHDHSLGRIVLPAHVARAETYPMGIDFQRFVAAARDPETEAERNEIRATLRNMRSILSVDRLDYSKGILNRLEAYELLLERHPEYHGAVVLIAVVVPSRIGVDQYETMKRQIEEIVGRINGRFGTVAWTPVIYQYRNLGLHSLSALYSVSDVGLVTPLRDGMNLVAKEYIASRSDHTGVLVLSEMAGAAKELGEALIVNPNDRGEMADAMHTALQMPEEEQRQRNIVMQERLLRYDVTRWAGEFLKDLGEMEEVRNRFTAKLLTHGSRGDILRSYAEAQQRQLFLDYDGTLVPFVRHPSLAKPPERLHRLLTQLADDPRNSVVILSGRDRASLDRWLGHLPIGLAAEHGFWLKDAGGQWTNAPHPSTNWKFTLRAILDQHADRLPGAFVEEKEFSLVWHYRSSDPDQARPIAAELIDQLTSYTTGLNVQVLPGNKVVEVRTAGIHKGTAASHWLSGRVNDHILAIGDDWTDEDLFRALPPNSFTIRVGITNTVALYNVRGPEDVLRLLESLALSHF